MPVLPTCFNRLLKKSTCFVLGPSGILTYGISTLRVPRRLRPRIWSFFTSLKSKRYFPETAGKTEIARSGFFMGGPWEIRVSGSGSSEAAVHAGFREIARVESLLSRFRPESEITRINRWDGCDPLRIEAEVFGVISSALKLASSTGGAFDPGSGAFRGAFKQIRLHPSEPVLLGKPDGLEIDMGAIGKGYGVDCAVAVLKSAGIPNGRVSAGSTAYAWGNSPEGNAWRFGIRNPRDPEGIIQSVPVRDGAVSSSGNDEQFGHIRDPRSGRPVKRSGLVTVLASTAAEADALSTAAFVLGENLGLGFLESQKEVEGLFVGQAGPSWQRPRVHSTPGWPVSREKALSRRSFLAGLAAAAALVMMAPLSALAKVYLSPEKALRKVLPDAEEFEELKVSLSPDQKEKFRELLGKELNGGDFTIYRGFLSGSNETVGYGVVVDVIGKERPITFMVGVGPGDRIAGVEVMVYRESRGFEIRSNRFRKQFRGISLEDSLKMGQDFYGISGATLSSRSTAFAVRKAMALTKILNGAGGQ